MSDRLAYVFINGILTLPGDSEGWTDRAVTWINTRTADKAEKWEYAAGPILRRVKQQERAEKIATLCAFYERTGYQVVLVGHSNGCDIIARVLKLRGVKPWYFTRPIRSIHLFSPAADAADFLLALEAESVGRVFIYRAGQDRALALGQWSRRLLGWAGLGYGSLGLASDDDTAGLELEYRPGVTVYDVPEFGHSDWFTRGEQFERTMVHLDRAEAVNVTDGTRYPLVDPSIFST